LSISYEIEGGKREEGGGEGGGGRGIFA